MTDTQKTDRTWLCSVLFTDIVGYSSQSVDAQMKLKTRFNAYLAQAIHDVPESERVILDTGDGAAVCFLGAPEAAMFAALHLRQNFVDDAKTEQQPLRVRIGINLGPVKLVKDINGALNAIGDGINAGQRVMSFSGENQILVARAFYDVVSRVSDDYKKLFRLKGVETDKHVRKHTVYTLSPPGVEPPDTHPVANLVVNPGGKPAAKAPAAVPPKKSGVKRLVLGALVVLVVLGAWRHVATWRQMHPPRTPEAQAAYDEGERLVADKKASEALPKFEDALKANANDVPALLGRAAARRMTGQYEASADDCNRAQKLAPEESRVYECRGRAEAQLKLTAVAINDFTEAIKLNPKSSLSYEARGNANIDAQQYAKALQDFNKAIELKPTLGRLYVRRGVAYQNLQQYDNAIKDYSQAIVMEPENVYAYNMRAAAEHQSNDDTAADADRRKAQELRQSQRFGQSPEN